MFFCGAQAILSGRAKQASPSSRASRHPAGRAQNDRSFWILIAILSITSIVYLRCLGNGFVFDDHEMISANHYIGNWSFLWRALVNDSWWFRDPAHLPQSHYYRPLQDIWLGLNYQLFGLNPIGWHALMVGLHLCAVVLAFRIAALLAGSKRCGLITALLFGLMPIHAEPVVWATAIPESLAGTLELAAFYGLVLFHRNGDRRAMYLSMASVVGALLSHESAISFPIIAAAYVWMFSDRSGATVDDLKLPQRVTLRMKAVIRETARYFLLGAAYFGARLAILGFIARRDVNNHATLAQLILTLPSVLADIVVLLIMPWRAGPSHRVEWVNQAAAPAFVVPLLGLSFLAAAGYFVTGNTPEGKNFRFCVAWILIALLPTLNLAALYPNALVTDRYLYLASYGWCLMLALAAESVMTKVPTMAVPAEAAVAVLAAIYGISLWQVQRYWHDEIELFTRCIEVFPAQEFCHNRLGMALFQSGELDGAEQELRQALQLDPEDYAAQYDLGLVLVRQRRIEEASQEMATALKHLSNLPVSAYIELAELYDAAGQDAAREATLKEAQQLPGGAIEVGLARARRLLARGDGAGAQHLLEPLLAEQPDNLNLLVAMGSAMAEQGQFDEALRIFQKALALQPDNPQTRMLVAATQRKLGRN